MSDAPRPPAAEPRNVYRWIVIVGVVGAVAWFVYNVLPPRVDRDIGHYESMRGKVTGALDLHFPDEPPAGSKVSFPPPFLQGGGHFQLRAPASAAEIARIEGRAKRLAVATFPGGESMHDYKIPTTLDHTSGVDRDRVHYGPLPAAFTHYVLVAAPNWHAAFSGADQTEPDWESGSTAGVSVSPSTGEIIYWAEWW